MRQCPGFRPGANIDRARSGRWRSSLRAACLVVVTTACNGPLDGGQGDISDVARTHLETLISVMQANSINRKRIDWADFTRQVMADAKGAQTISDTYAAVHTALGLLGDGHSTYYPAAGGEIENTGVLCSGALVQSPYQPPPSIGYVQVGAFHGNNTLAEHYANSLRFKVTQGDSAQVIGWIVDLRGNYGGDMWPMVAGLGPLFGSGVLGYFINPDSVQSDWSFASGTALLGGTPVFTVNPYQLLTANLPVAVLTDGLVASSGEGVAIGFIGRPRTRFFGTSTCGVSTANTPFTVGPDQLYLTTAVMADRARHIYGGSINPDEVINDETQVILRAIAWIQSQ